MTITIEPASKTDSKLRGYYVGKINSVTVCCCKGAKSTLANTEFLANQSPHLLRALIESRRSA